jgi:hypothetical protein
MNFGDAVENLVGNDGLTDANKSYDTLNLTRMLGTLTYLRSKYNDLYFDFRLVSIHSFQLRITNKFESNRFIWYSISFINCIEPKIVMNCGKGGSKTKLTSFSSFENTLSSLIQDSN